MHGDIPPLPNTPSWRGAYLKHRDNFTFTFTFLFLIIGFLDWESVSERPVFVCLSFSNSGTDMRSDTNVKPLTYFTFQNNDMASM